MDVFRRPLVALNGVSKLSVVLLLLLNLNINVCLGLYNVSQRSILLSRSTGECGQVPIYKSVYKKNAEPSLVSLAKSHGPNMATVEDQLGSLRILHGLDAKSGEWPWIAQVDACTHTNGQQVCESCTGTLLNERWILTAGHCVKANNV